MQALRKPSTRAAIAAITFAASMIMGAGQVSAAAESAYCNYANGWVYCGTEEFIYEGDPRLPNCLMRWEMALADCPPDWD